MIDQELISIAGEYWFGGQFSLYFDPRGTEISHFMIMEERLVFFFFYFLVSLKIKREREIYCDKSDDMIEIFLSRMQDLLIKYACYLKLRFDNQELK